MHTWKQQKHKTNQQDQRWCTWATMALAITADCLFLQIWRCFMKAILRITIFSQWTQWKCSRVLHWRPHLRMVYPKTEQWTFFFAATEESLFYKRSQNDEFGSIQMKLIRTGTRTECWCNFTFMWHCFFEMALNVYFQLAQVSGFEHWGLAVRAVVLVAASGAFLQLWQSVALLYCDMHLEHKREPLVWVHRIK